jgi:hypothetical protein
VPKRIEGGRIGEAEPETDTLTNAAFTHPTILPFLFEWTDLDEPVERRKHVGAREA